MTLAVMQPYLFPYIGYFQLINAVDRFVIFDDVNFINKGWLNRNYVLVNGKANLFTVPLQDSSQNKLIKDILISEDRDWRSKFLKTIELNYRRAPFFNEIFELIRDTIQNSGDNISKFIYSGLRRINVHLGINTTIIESSSLYLNNGIKQQHRIIDICKKENADRYINLPGGKELYSKEIFNANNIDLKFIESGEIRYKQFDNSFVKSLSIIDVMMFNSKERVNEFLNDYQLT